jgi:hypothetical protein
MLKFRNKETILYFNEDGNVGSILSKKQKDRTYKILETPLLIESKCYQYGNIVSAEKKSDGKFWIKEVINKSEYETEVYIWNKEMINSNTFNQLSKKLSEIGGSYDIAMGGVVSIYYPKNFEFNLSSEIEKIKTNHIIT